MDRRWMPVSRLLEPDEIHQAAGMLSGQLDIPILDAYAVFDHHARRLCLPGHALAIEILESGLRLDRVSTEGAPLGR